MVGDFPLQATASNFKAMNDENQISLKKVLQGEEALKLWRKGRNEWNNWIDQHPDYIIRFSDINFSTEQISGDVISFAGYHFGNGIVDFSRTKFGDEHKVDFSNSRFGNNTVKFFGTDFGDCDVLFSDAHFGKGKVHFSQAKFGSGDLYFVGTKFGEGEVEFSGVIFGSRHVSFYGATFDNGSAHFNRAMFSSSSLDLSGITFQNGGISFQATEFGKCNVGLYAANFKNGNVDFSDATFDGGIVDFSQTTCRNCNVIFNRAKFAGLIFEPETFVSGQIEAKHLSIQEQALLLIPPSAKAVSSFNFRGASFGGSLTLSAILDIVPDLRGTRSSHQIELSDLDVKLRRIPHSRNWLKRLYSVAEDPEDAARLRRLKEIAEANKDHQAALRFSADENRARRWTETSWFGSVLDMAFSASSNYGQSILRPSLSLGFFFILGIGIYNALATVKCLGWLTALGQSTLLSVSNSLPFLPQSRELRTDALKALYTGDPGFWVDALMIGQGVLSFVFLFLIGLGLRNRFRL